MVPEKSGQGAYHVAQFADFALGQRLAREKDFDLFVEPGQPRDRAIVELGGCTFSHFVSYFNKNY
jgi:hypothetical protein